MTRRALLALLSASAVLSACGGGVAPAASVPPPEPLALGSAVDLVPAAGLVWLVDARLRELFASEALLPAIALVLPSARLDAFARRHGGIDLRSASELALAGYPDATLAVARAVLDPARVEAAFAARAVAVEGRAVEGSVVRTWGTVGSARQQIAILGREALALEQGRFGPLRAAEYFAQGRLKRARPALQAEPLLRTAALLGDAPLRAFAPGPFPGATGRGLGGLLAAATAVGAAATPSTAIPAARSPSASWSRAPGEPTRPRPPSASAPRSRSSRATRSVACSASTAPWRLSGLRATRKCCGSR